MKLLNHNYQNIDLLKKFIAEHHISNSNSVLMQIFHSNTSIETIQNIKDELHQIIPNATLITSSTAGVIEDGSIKDNYVSISFSLFSASTTKSIGYCSLSDAEIMDELAKNIITEKTKLLLIYSNTFKFSSQILLKKITEQYPNLTIAGGNAGDDFNFKRCYVSTASQQDCDIAFAPIDSDILKVETRELFNWQAIGKELTVTKSEGNRVYEIDNINVVELYKHYLGSEIMDNFFVHSLEFPLILQENGIEIGRSPITHHEDDSLTFGGEIKVGAKVKFGYANVDYIDRYNKEFLLKEYKYKSEAIYLYSCSTRRSMLEHYLNEEVNILNTVAPTTGFIAYGEFFHDSKSCTNNFLNITTTYILLNEKEQTQSLDVNYIPRKNVDEHAFTLKALTTLISNTSKELDEQSYYLEQFHRVVQETSIFSVTDENGIIRDCNHNFEAISGYNKYELIGKHHNIIKDADVPKKTLKELWTTIESGQIWKGFLKNRKKDGTPYYVISQISPIYNKDGSFREYIAIRNDVTELEEYKHILKTQLNATSENLQNKINYTLQYEAAINTMIALVKTDTNNKITYVNNKFCELSGYSPIEVIGKDCSIIRNKEDKLSQEWIKAQEKFAKKEVTDNIVTNITKTGKRWIVRNLSYPIADVNANVIEYLHIMHDLTEIIELNEEITTTQKEVVMTMGAIGETRSQETGLHVKRVAEYSYLLAKLANVSEEDASLLKQASPMHDIGKVGIADSILNKPGKLTSEEFEIMKTHAMLGYEMLKYSNRPILKAAAIIAKTHHEKYDGSGYPEGFKGEDIPIFGRITAIADVFDALGHDRCYKKAWKLDDILKLFREENGKHFDPNLIKLFFDNLDQFLLIRDEFQD